MDERPWQRSLSLRRCADDVVEASIEDFIHHFRLELEHDGTMVTELRGEAVRAPWSVCPGGTTQLRELSGSRLDQAPRPQDPTEHCTHLLDLAGVAVRFAGAPGRLTPDRPGGPRLGRTGVDRHCTPQRRHNPVVNGTGLGGRRPVAIRWPLTRVASDLGLPPRSPAMRRRLPSSSAERR